VSPVRVSDHLDRVPTLLTRRSSERPEQEYSNMGYGIGGILVLILVILAIIYLAKRV
jgi:hypothetical protein